MLEMNCWSFEQGIFSYTDNTKSSESLRVVVPLGPDVCWSETQLIQELQGIISKHRPYFDGLAGTPEDVETESESELIITIGRHIKGQEIPF